MLLPPSSPTDHTVTLTHLKGYTSSLKGKPRELNYIQYCYFTLSRRTLTLKHHVSGARVTNPIGFVKTVYFSERAGPKRKKVFKEIIITHTQRSPSPKWRPGKVDRSSICISDRVDTHICKLQKHFL